MVFDNFDAGSLLDYLKNNSTTILLFIFVILQCLGAVILLFKKNVTYFLIGAATHFPTLALLIADVFFGKSWNGLTGYVLGISVVSILIVWAYNDDNDKISKEIISKGFTTVLLCIHLIFG